MTNMQLLVTTHRIPAHDRHNDDHEVVARACGTTLSLALGEKPSGFPEDGLWPWQWPAIQRLVIFTGPWPQGETWLKAAEVEVSGPAKGREQATDFDLLQTRLRKIRDRKHGWIDGWSGPEIDVPADGEKPWPALVAELSQLPWPYAQALNLSMGFEIASADLGDLPAQILAVPVVRVPLPKAEGNEGPEVEDPDAETPPTEIVWQPRSVEKDMEAPEGNAQYKVIYAPDLAPLPASSPFASLTALTEAEELNGPVDGDRMMISNLWVQAGDPSLDPWLERVDAGLVSMVDLVPFALTAFENQTWKIEGSKLREIVITLCRDLIGLGGTPWTGSIPQRSGWTTQELRSREARLFETTARGVDEWIKKVVKPAFKRDDLPPEVRQLAATAARLDVLAPAVAIDGRQLVAQLRQLHELLRRPEVVRALYLQQVDAVAGNGAGAAIQSVVDEDRDLVYTLALECAERVRRLFWNQLAAGGGQEKEPAEALKLALEQEVHGRLGKGLPRPESAPRLAERSAAATMLPKVDDLLASLTPETSGDDRYDRPRLAEGVSVQVDRLAENDDNDLQTRLRGIGLLARRTDSGGWHHLHVAEAGVSAGDPIGIRVLRPAKIAASRGLRMATLTYDNEPMSVEGPRARMAARAGFRLEGGDQDDEYLPVEFSFFRDRALACMPGLVFGSSYQFLPFLVTNCGALPKQLVADGRLACEPRWATGTGGLTIDLSKLPDNVKPVTIRYRRRASLGPVRVVGAGGKPEKLDLPSMPRDVIPRLPEVIKNGDQRLPLVFLALAEKAAGKWSFSLRPPATDLETWDRWVAAGNATGQLRARVRAAAVLRARKNALRGRARAASAATGKADLDASFDDPAVTRRADLILEEIDFMTGKEVAGRSWTLSVDWPERAGDSAWRQVQADPLPFDIEAMATGMPAINGKNAKLPPGLYRLSIDVTVEGEDRFVTAPENSRTPLFHIEVADLTTPWPVAAASELWSKLRLADNGKQGHLEFELKLEPSDPLWRQVAGATLQRQSWSWQGRPLPPGGHPSLQLPEPTADGDQGFACGPDHRLIQWEVQEMGWRSDEEHLSMPMELAAVETSDKPRRFVVSEPMVRDGADDVRAAHHRFAVEVRHRYAGLLAAKDRTRQSLDPACGLRWRRAFIPCRWRRAVNVPRIRLVLPLTEHEPLDGEVGAGHKLSSAGLLVVVDEPWFEHGGLAESFEAEVVSIPGPGGREVEMPCTDAKALKGNYYQLGPDPIVGRHAFGGSGLRKEAHSVTFEGRIHGPVGHTFDRVSSGGRFVASSFFVRPPEIANLDPGDDIDAGQDWAFIQLRFRRVLRVEGDGGKMQLRESAWTEPHWAQLLPPFTKVGRETFKITPDTAVLSGAKIELWAKGVPAGIRSEPDAGRPFLPALILTRGVPDAAGGGLQEAYVDVFLPGEGGWVANKPESLALLEPSNLRLRVLQVQGPATALKALAGRKVDFWQSIFGTPRDGDVPADRLRSRITAISEPLKDLEFRVEGAPR